MLPNYVMKTLIGIFTDSSHNIHEVYSESNETSLRCSFEAFRRGLFSQ